MEEELKKSLRYIQSNPTTGLPHNQQLISTQVESIFMLDNLCEKIILLNKTIEDSDKISQKLEQSNYRLQWAMLILTAITTFVAVYPILKTLITSLFSINSFGFSVTAATSGFIAAALTGIIAGILLSIEKKSIDHIVTANLADQIKFRDSIEVVLRDKDGKIKEKREIKNS